MTLIDHYDSFTFNVIEWLTAADPTIEVRYVAYDDAEGMARLRAHPTPIVISPGPKRPEDAPQTLAIVQELLGIVPILGICLGHQMLGHLAGAAVIRSAAPFHGTTRTIKPTADAAAGLMSGMTPGFKAAVYHSLVVHPAGLKSPWQITAVDDLGEVQGLARVVDGEAPAFGVQFHPESFLSQNADRLRANWLEAIASWKRRGA